MATMTISDFQASGIMEPSQESVAAHWYAAYTRPRHEKRVVEELDRRAIETFLPVYETVRKWKNGRHRVQLPLFPGYAFVRIPLHERLKVLRIPSVVSLVGANGRPIALRESEVASLRHALSKGTRAEPHPFLTEGRRVRITSGPFAGLQGVLKRRKGQAGIVVSLELIQRSVLVEVGAAELEPLT